MANEIDFNKLIKKEHYAILTSLTVPDRDPSYNDSDYVTYESFPTLEALKKRIKELVESRQSYMAIKANPLTVKTELVIDLES